MCSLDIAFTSATVRNRPREVTMAVPMASFATAVTFGGFRSRVASFRVAGVALYVFQHVSYRVKSRFFSSVAGAMLLQPPSSFRVAGTAL